MPPRVPIPATRAASSLVRGSADTACCLRQTKPSQVSTVASFSTTVSRPKFSKQRRFFREWEKDQGRTLGAPEKPSYLGKDHRPFPNNPYFKSEPVLSERARELIWEKVMRKGEAIKVVSAEYGVDIRRVAAVVRLKEVEKDWIAKGKPLATVYSKAMMTLLPKHHIDPEAVNQPFEPINEIHVHPHTMQQIFWPTSESRKFTREDAAFAFNADMLSADKRIPHPELVQMEKDMLAGGQSKYEAAERFKEAAAASERKAAERQIAKAAAEEAATTRVNTSRFEFRFKGYNAENVGSRGKARSAVGWRYGAPYEDRAQGHQIKIPTSVP
ncbi:eukaryotic mitochondrial regulator protein-domain-containing protein [Poronia punctata]|nr:eukaryotic mitochondrial regulator protein-domain-containing protein [Poronia punctata]